MADGPLRYAGGAGTAIAHGSVVVLLNVPPESLVVLRIFDVLDHGGELDDVLDVLVSGGLKGLADFGAAAVAPEGVRLVVRGSIEGTVGAGERFRSTHAMWQETWHPGAASVSIGKSGEDDEASLPLRSGVVPACCVRLGSATPVVDVAAPPLDVAQPAEVAARAADAPPVAGTDRASAAPSPSSPPPAPAPQPADDSSAPWEDFDHLFGATQLRPGEVSPAPEPPASPPPAVRKPTAGETLPGPLTVPVSELPSPAPTSAPEKPMAGLITGFPWEIGGSPAVPTVPASVPAPVPSSRPIPVSTPAAAQAGLGAVPSAPAPPAEQPSPPEPPSGADMTVNRSTMRGNGPSAVTVVAARCPHGHLSPAYAGNCRVCRAPLPAQQPFEIPRPKLGQLRLSTGGIVSLDRPVILGRNPRIPPGYQGEQPNLIQVNDPGRDVSGQHLEVSLDYWNVVVRDLGSTNGTEVVLPGEMPFTLRAKDPVIIEPGTRVVLAGAVSFVFEVSE